MCGGVKPHRQKNFEFFRLEMVYSSTFLCILHGRNQGAGGARFLA